MCSTAALLGQPVLELTTGRRGVMTADKLSRALLKPFRPRGGPWLAQRLPKWEQGEGALNCAAEEGFLDVRQVPKGRRCACPHLDMACPAGPQCRCVCGSNPQQHPPSALVLQG